MTCDLCYNAFMGKVLAVCTSTEKGTVKRDVGRAEFVVNHGLSGDAHAGHLHRQVSLLSHQKIEDFRKKGAKIEHGNFGENLVIEGIDLSALTPGTFLECGDVILEITQIGKECHNRCAIYNVMGDCIMPREGIFTKVICGGFIAAGDEIKIRPSDNSTADKYHVWIITASDKGFNGTREDKSAPVIREIAVNAGFAITGFTLLPDDKETLENELKRICDSNLADLILTTGGTGFSARDCMPEATVSIAHRLVPGIPEAMRAASLQITKRAMFSRSVAAIRGKTLIINLPGSPKAAKENLEFIIDELWHGLDILTGKDSECARE